MKAAALAILVASIWGINPIFEKLALNGASPFSVITIRFIFTTACLVVIALATGKYTDFGNVDGTTLFWILLSGLVGGLLGLFLYFVALEQDYASRIIPIIATFPVFTAFYAHIFLDESITTRQFIGILFAVTGVILINWNKAVGIE